MASYARVTSAILTNAATISQAFGLTYTPVLGDIIYVSGGVSVGTNLALGGTTGVTYGLKVLEANAIANEFGAVFRADSGTPAEGDLTLTSDDSFRDATVIVVRPTDATYVGEAGSDNSGGSAGANLPVDLSAAAPAVTLAFFSAEGLLTWSEDGTNGFTEIALTDEGNASGRSHQAMYKLTSATQVIGTPSSSAIINGIAIEFTDAAGAAATRPAGINRGLINNGLINGGLIR